MKKFSFHLWTSVCSLNHSSCPWLHVCIDYSRLDLELSYDNPETRLTCSKPIRICAIDSLPKARLLILFEKGRNTVNQRTKELWSISTVVFFSRYSLLSILRRSVLSYEISSFAELIPDKNEEYFSEDHYSN